ncbi:MAG: M24 family metallopeptidase [Patescibacteria group bacterium]|jgi:Xaa-Pro aminopeptidase
MPWTKKQIEQHKKAAKVLNEIIKKIVKFIKDNPKTTDVEVRQFIKKQYKKYHLKSDKQKSIVAFGDDTSNVHFYAEQPRRLKNGDLIMIDIWSRLAEIGAPFADITWMMYYGVKAPKEHLEAFKIVAKARDKAVSFLKNNLPVSPSASRGGKKKIIPIGKEVDAVVRNYLEKYGHGDKFLHGTGHSLGFVSPHGTRTRISRNGKQSLPLNVGYTIEPGIYFKNLPPHLICKNKNFFKKTKPHVKCGGEFGIRSEIDFYIDKNFKLIITTKVQNKIINIHPVK